MDSGWSLNFAFANEAPGSSRGFFVLEDWGGGLRDEAPWHISAWPKVGDGESIRKTAVAGPTSPFTAVATSDASNPVGNSAPNPRPADLSHLQ